MANTNSNVDTVSPVTPNATLDSAFLAIPIELRDEIYSHIASNDPASPTLTFNSQPLASASYVYDGLLHACKQTRHEYTGALLRYSGITATIEHFDFQPFAAFLGQLPSTYLDSLPKQLAPLDLTAIKTDFINPGAKVYLNINIGDDVPSALEGLRRWLIKQRSLEDSGSRLRICYRFVDRPDLHVRLGLHLPDLIKAFEGVDDAITRAELFGMMRVLLKGETFFSDPDEAGFALRLLTTFGLSSSLINELFVV